MSCCFSKCKFIQKILPKKFRKNVDGSSDSCSTEQTSCSTKKCCPCKCLVKLAVLLCILFILNTYLGFSDKAIDKYIQNNPRRIIDAVENMVKNERQKRTEDGGKKAAKVADELANNSNIPFVGNKDGSKVVVEFYDYNCGHCRKAHNEVGKVVVGNHDVKLILVNTPIMSEASLIAAKASNAVFKITPEYFAEFHDKLMKTQGEVTANIVTSTLKSVVKGKFDSVKSYMDSKENDDLVQKTYEMMKDIGLQGTPAFIVNKKLVPGFMTAKEINDALND